MTLRQLYDAIDWSGAEEAYLKWSKGKEVADEDIPDFKEAWRTALLLCALPKEMLPEKAQKDWTLERQQEARWMLNAAGAWPQVVSFLNENNMLGDADVEADWGRSDSSEGRGGAGGADNHTGFSKET